MILNDEDYLSEIDYDSHYCESNPSYYCDLLYCESKEYNYKCPFKENKKKENINQ